MLSKFVLAASAVAMLGAGFASAEGTRSFEALPLQQTVIAADGNDNGSEKCRVDVIRTGTPGIADVTRTTNNGTCVCIVMTGQENVNGSAESVVKAVLNDRSCDGAPAPGAVVSEAAAGGGGAGAILPILLSTVGAGGLAAAAGGGGGNDSKG